MKISINKNKKTQNHSSPIKPLYQKHVPLHSFTEVALTVLPVALALKKKPGWGAYSPSTIRCFTTNVMGSKANVNTTKESESKMESHLNCCIIGEKVHQII